jgi:hypothetical protein
MEHPHGIIINNIIQQFNQVGMGVKADKQILFVLPLNRMVKEFECKRPPDVIPGNPMLKRRLAERDDKVHILFYLKGGGNAKPGRNTGIPEIHHRMDVAEQKGADGRIGGDHD